ncbi:MAG TPA: S8 family serine peptidase, partial [Solirubrobacteraceae bacterium]|nr:S8 family serine peptidase [Solirubrobacteraceae bacterium]
MSARRLPLLVCALLTLAVAVAPAAAQPPKPAPPPGSGPAAPLGSVAAPGSGAITAGAYKPGELLVGFERAATASERASARRNGRVKFKEKLLVADVEVVETDDDQTVPGAAAALRRQPRVRFAEPNYYRHLDATANDTHFGLEWGLHNTAQGVLGRAALADADIDAPEAWDFQTGSAAVKVAVIDTGIHASHPDLRNNIGPGYDFVDGDSLPQDLNGHGTHVAGTIGAEGNNATGIAGVAWDVEIMPLRVFGAADHTTDSIIVNAFQYAASNGARVANASLGGSGPGSAYQTVVQNNPNTLYVVSAGNGGADGVGDNNEVTPQFPCNVTAANLICVAASNQSDQRASFSNYGTTSVDIAAPGTEIYSPIAEATRVYSDTFETSPLPYTTTGAWGYHNNASLNWTPNGSWTLADSPSGSYPHNSDTSAQRNHVNLSGLTNCNLSFKGYVHSEPGYDFLRVEVSSGGGAWTELARYSGSASNQFQRTLYEHFNLSAYSNRSEFWLRFRFTSDGDNASISGNPGLDGAFIDDVVLECNNGNPPRYAYLQGTSMAAPHVAGAAALLLSQRPAAGTLEVRSAILDNGDPVTGIPTVTNKRLNAYGALLKFVPPNTTLTGTPPSLTRSTSASFNFTTDQVQSTFECSLDGGAFSACTSPRTYPGLSDGTHTVQVRARNRAGVVDPTPATHTWRIDTQPPDTTITANPASVTNATSASFSFTSTEAGASFECALDSGGFAPCSSPRTYTGLAQGSHTFRVRSTDPAGNVDPAAATYQWTVDTQAPDTTIFAMPAAVTSDSTASFSFSSSETGASFECSLD